MVFGIIALQMDGRTGHFISVQEWSSPFSLEHISTSHCIAAVLLIGGETRVYIYIYIYMFSLLLLFFIHHCCKISSDFRQHGPGPVATKMRRLADG